MSKCDNCRLRKESARTFDIHWHGKEDCPYDVCPEIKTNGDRIRAMSDEELVDYLIENDCPVDECKYEDEYGNVSRSKCRYCWLEWLREEAQDD